MSKSTILLFITWALILVALSFLSGYATRKILFPQEPPITVTDTVWKWQRDTVFLADSKPVGSVIVRVPVVERDTVIIASNDTILVAVAKDSAAVEIPIEQRTYEGEYYRAVVQGFRPELVSIDVRHPEIHIPVQKRKLWSVTVGPQVGYGFTPAGWQPYAGAGVSVGISF